ncbi:MAG: hypothetical protein II440_07815 [Clostridia bacterium]|nr:hypothetical protein [Clostridia bacterium]
MSFFCLVVLSGCSLTAKQPAPPLLELDGRTCEVTFRNNTYTAEISLPHDNTTVIKFTSPDSIANTQYTFTDSELEIKSDALVFSCDTEYLQENSLPSLIDCVLTDIISESSVVYCGTAPDADNTSTLALYSGDTDNFTYTVKTDFDTGITKEIISEDKRLKIIIL